jgi:hypothetical protein
LAIDPADAAQEIGCVLTEGWRISVDGRVEMWRGV